MRNPAKVKSIYHKNWGNLEFPKNRKTTYIKDIAKNESRRKDFEKYMNPGGIKTTITSRFKTPPKEIEFVSHEMILARSPKPYDKNIISFRCSPFLSKPEITQYLSKVYKLPVNRVDTVNKMGEVKKNVLVSQNAPGAGRYRKKNWKKAIVTLDYEVDSDYRNFN